MTKVEKRTLLLLDRIVSTLEDIADGMVVHPKQTLEIRTLLGELRNAVNEQSA